MIVASNDKHMLLNISGGGFSYGKPVGWPGNKGFKGSTETMLNMQGSGIINTMTINSNI